MLELEGRFCWREKQVNWKERGGDSASLARESGLTKVFPKLGLFGELCWTKYSNRFLKRGEKKNQKRKEKKKGKKEKKKCPAFSDKSNGCFFVCFVNAYA